MQEEMYAARVEEVDSEDGQEVRVDALGRRILSDELRFTGGDLAPYGRRDVYAYQDTYGDSESDSDEDYGEDASEQQIALRDKEEALVQSALARIRRAQEKGKVEVNLRQDELAALENRRKRLQAEAAAKAKSAQSSRKGSASDGKKPKRNSPPMATVPIMHPDIQYAAASSGSAERPSSRRRSNQKVLNEAVLGPAPGGPGILVEDAQGRVTYQPINYQGSPSRPRSSSSLSAKNYGGRQPQVQQGYPYSGGYLPGRHASDNTRPPSSASQSSRPLPHEEGWVDSRRSSINSQMSHHDPFAYEVRRGDGTPPPAIPEERYYAQPQGSYSQPSGIQYSNVIRAPYGYNGGDSRQYLQNNSSDPTMLRQRMPAGVEVEESEDELSVPSSKPSPKPDKQSVPKRKPVGKKKGKR